MIEASSSVMQSGVMPAAAQTPLEGMPSGPDQQYAGFGRRLAVAVTAIALTAGCSTEGNPGAPTQAIETTPSHSQYVHEKRPAQTPNINFGVIVAGIEGAETQQYDEQSAMSLVGKAEQDITKATGGLVAFAQPKYYGKVSLKLPNGQDRCKTDKENTTDKKFRDEFISAATDEAEKNGYNYDVAAGAGLIVLANYTCTNEVRSQASYTQFRADNVITITNPRTELEAPLSRTVAHEIGHGLGSEHADASGKDCADGVRGNDCSAQEYGSRRSIMGDMGSSRNTSAKPDDSIFFNGYELNQMGVMRPEQILDITKAGVHEVTLDALRPGQNGTQLVRIPRHVDHTGDLDNNHYWLELSPGARDFEDNTGCEYADFVTNCDHPFRLGLAMLTANGGNDKKISSHTTLIPIAGSRNPGNHKGYGGLIGPPAGENKTIYTDEKTGLTVELLEVNDNRDRTGNAKVRITLTKDLE